MITKKQAMELNEFYDDQGRRWRRNGQTQTWKKDLDRFRVPVKYGLYSYDAITNLNASYFHPTQDGM